MGSTAKKDFLNKTKKKFYEEIKFYQQSLKPTKEIEGYGSAPIVGEKNYPFVATHSVSNENKKNSFFNTSEIVKRDYSEIIKLKAKNILGSTDKNYIKKTNTKITEELRDIYKAKKPIEFNSKFEKELKFDKVLISKVSGIVGSKNELLNINANENTQTSKQIEKYTVNDIKSKEAIINLYERGTNENQIINLLALGSFGIEINKKLVPTKWAISAYDQTIERYLFDNYLRKNKIIENYEIYHKSDKGNEFVIILLPQTITGEVVESFPGAVERDYFDYKNKLDNKEPQTSGGYYATKIAIFEHLKQRKRQASIISIRIIKDYDIPLGVVFVRECVREAMNNKIFSSSDKKELNSFLKAKYFEHYNLYLNSKLLKENRKQFPLTKFI